MCWSLSTCSLIFDVTFGLQWPTPIGHNAAKKVQVLVAFDVPEVLHRSVICNERLLIVVRDRRPNEFLVLANDFVRSCFSHLGRGRHSVCPFSWCNSLEPSSIGRMCSRLRLRAGNLAIRFSPAISKKSPGGAHLCDFI